jgi:UDP-sulfoquinovose synthase
VHDITTLALKVQRVGAELGLSVSVQNLENPRLESEEHYYNPDHQCLFDLGYTPTHGVEEELRPMLRDLMRYRDRIEARRDVLIPDVRWSGLRAKVRSLELGGARRGE